MKYTYKCYNVFQIRITNISPKLTNVTYDVMRIKLLKRVLRKISAPTLVLFKSLEIQNFS
jgi:hypothetical protein